MKIYHKVFLTFSILLSALTAVAQTSTSAVAQLVAEGRQFLKEKNAVAASEKFAAALKIDSTNTELLFQEGFCLIVTGRHNEALTYFEKVISLPNNIPMAYAYIGDIYSIRHEFQKAIMAYTKAVSIMPRNQQVWYTLGLAYLQNNQPSQAQAAEAESIKINPRWANNQQIYGFAALAQGRTAEALLAFSSYLMYASPKENTATESYKLLKLTLIPNHKIPASSDPVAKMQQDLLIKTAAVAVAGKTNLTSIDSLTLQSTSIFNAIKSQQEQYGSSFFSKYYGDYFGALATTENMNTFAHVISWCQQPAETEAWIKDHPENVKTLAAWVTETKRQTE